jgi:hypothetical protein
MIDVDSAERLLAAIDEAYQRATTCFLQDSPFSLHGVIWLSAHLAAMERAIDRSVDRRIPEAHDQLEAQRQLGRRLQQLLRTLEEQRAGDGLASHQPWAKERRDLLDELDKHASGERALISALTARLDDDAIDRIHADYVTAFERGPTRPHPYGPHRGRLGTALLRLSAVRDHVLDALDSRTSPISRKPVERKPRSRWGQYLLGVSDFGSRLAEDPEIGDPRLRAQEHSARRDEA